MSSSGRGLSLRQKLPLLISGLSVVALLAGGLLAYYEVRGSVRDAAESRLQSLTREFVALTQTTLTTRVGLEDRVVASPAVRAAVTGRVPDSAGLSGLLESLRTNSDGNLPVAVLDADGQPTFTLG